LRFENEIFGTEEQKQVTLSALKFWANHPSDPDITFNGRVAVTVGNVECDLLIKLARAQGASTAHFLHRRRQQEMAKAVEAAGYVPAMWELCVGEHSAIECARQMISDFALPDDLKIIQIDKSTDTKVLADLAQLATDCGVMPMTGRVMRGLDMDGVTLGAVDQSGSVVATAWGYKCYEGHPEFKDFAFWGGLACREDRRGKKVAQLLGAHSIERLWDMHEVRGFATGVAPGNDASFSVCANLGVLPSKWVAVGAADPSKFAGGKLTK